MSERQTTKPSPVNRRDGEDREDRTDWRLLRSMSDREAQARAAQDPDAPPTDPGFWATAKVVLPPGKTKISLYVDNDVLRWFKEPGKGYQTRVNTVLRAYMDAQRAPRPLISEVAEPAARYDD